jgi:hypothetical protein
MGGIEALVTWANKDDNAKVFYSQIWPKIVPLTVGGDPDSPHRIEIVSRVVRSGLTGMSHGCIRAADGARPLQGRSWRPRFGKSWFFAGELVVESLEHQG